MCHFGSFVTLFLSFLTLNVNVLYILKIVTVKMPYILPKQSLHLAVPKHSTTKKQKKYRKMTKRMEKKERERR